MERMKGEAEARARADRMARTSRKVRKESMLVNADLAVIDRDPVSKCGEVWFASLERVSGRLPLGLPEFRR
jgi:hypothetical protein